MVRASHPLLNVLKSDSDADFYLATCREILDHGKRGRAF